ncbi:MAG: hypothetical protein ACJAXV_000223 [Bacteroidia bacterium]|jgi:hypothetical protein|tara:strand:- start:813 stop:1967 length:1155 start_codon:yes stop_codon:yes gene_type:complete
MKKHLNLILVTLIFFGGFSKESKAQSRGLTDVILTTDPIVQSRLSTDAAFSHSVLSMLTEPINVYFEISIRAEKGFEVVAAKSVPTVVSPGANKFNSSNLRLVQKRYLNKDFGTFEERNGYLPTGSYSVCIAMKCADKECLSITGLYEIKDRQIFDCKESFSINPTPLLLASPMDESELETKRPNFSWIPPMPIGTDPEISYRFTLVELRDKQRGEAGIRRNRPIYQTAGLRTINMPFPAELEDLEVGKTYAWQVYAILGKTPVQTSEVWEFTIIEEEEEVFPMPYVRLKRTDEQIYNALNELKFIYNQEGPSKTLKYSILTLSGNKLNVGFSELDQKFGENSFKLDLTDLGLDHKEYYILSVQSDKGEAYNLKFRYYFKKALK